MAASDALEAPVCIPGLRYDPSIVDFPLLEIDNPLAIATVSLQGGQLLGWRPKNQAEPVLWLPDPPSLIPGKAIRGGMPVCWPWFGPHPDRPDFPAHGYARILPWELTAAAMREDGATLLTLRLPQCEQARTLGLQDVALSLRLVVGEVLEAELISENLGDTDCTIGEALHTYFRVGEVAACSVLGLEDCLYVDQATGARHRQAGAVRCEGETDRVYLHTEAVCTLVDPVLDRRIVVEKSGSHATVVWNPGADKAAKLGNLGSDGWRRMLCVESANVLDRVVALPPAGRHALSVRYRVLEGAEPAIEPTLQEAG